MIMMAMRLSIGVLRIDRRLDPSTIRLVDLMLETLSVDRCPWTYRCSRRVSGHVERRMHRLESVRLDGTC